MLPYSINYNAMLCRLVRARLKAVARIRFFMIGSHKKHVPELKASVENKKARRLKACFFFFLHTHTVVSTMADPSTCPPLTPASIREAHAKIQKYIHRTPVLTCRTIDRIASTPTSEGAPHPRVRIWFKCENMQKIGAFKARGAHHAILRLIDEMGLEALRKRGVVTHSSGGRSTASAYLN